ncbi:MAG: hypothetical protein M3217_10690, partial [Actinomycetota bacterium]|nr:hypothetical protein [Actinomycetota bacterium]
VLLGRDLTKVEQGLASSLAGVVAAAAITLSPLSLFGFGTPAEAAPSREPRVASPGTVWLSDAEIKLASASPSGRVAAAPRPANLDGESPLVRRASAAATRKGAAAGKGKPADESTAVVEVPLPGGEGEIEGHGGVDVDVEPPTIDPGDDNPLCDPTAPDCAPVPDRPSAHASVKVRVRDTTVSVSVNSDDVVASVETTDLKTNL